MSFFKKTIYLIFFFLLCLLFFYQTVIRGLLPIPADTIIGLYHPFRDLYSKDYPNGIPYKNFLITDPIRQQYPWKKLTIEVEKKLEVPTWNPYSLSGTPLLANFQSSPFYPLNIFLIILPFNIGWSVLIFSQILLAGIFMYLYLKNQNIRNGARVMGAIVFSFSGFSIAWLEWGTVMSTLLWTPLILLSVDKLFDNQKKWSLVLIFGLISSFFAGHLQIFFYSIGLFIGYIIVNFYKRNKIKSGVIYISFSSIIALIVVLPQFLPTLKFISLSARAIDLNWTADGWFIPFKHLVQFLIPDFFGNPTTLNYFGVWNYGEMVGFIGIIPLVLAVYSFSKKNIKILFFWIAIIVAFLFALPTPIAKLPYLLNIPIFSSSQPTRLLSIIDFSLAVLSAYGFEKLLSQKNHKKHIFWVLSGFLMVFFIIAAILFVFPGLTHLSFENLETAKRNFYFPALVLILGSALMFLTKFIKDIKFARVLLSLLVLLTIFDLFRFGWKFIPFTDQKYLFPSEKILTFLQNQEDKNFRIMSDNSEIFPPNFSLMYRLQSIEGYDPLYLLRYGEFISAMQRNRPDISIPFGFNRLITPRNYNSSIFPLLNVKYLLSFSDINNPNFNLVLTDNRTKLYEIKNFIPRAFFVSKLSEAEDNKQAIKILYNKNFDLTSNAVVEQFGKKTDGYSIGTAEIISYTENNIIIKSKNEREGFLVFLDSYYPTWKAKIDGKLTKIYQTDYNFRGIIIGGGNHTIEFSDNIL